MKKHPPPPTKYGPGAATQQKGTPQVRTGSCFLPPPTRYGPSSVTGNACCQRAIHPVFQPHHLTIQRMEGDPFSKYNKRLTPAQGAPATIGNLEVGPGVGDIVTIAQGLRDSSAIKLAALKEINKKTQEVQTLAYGTKRITASNFGKALHAEQYLCHKLATWIDTSVQRGEELPSLIQIIGSKKPCDTCRRVLLAFRDAMMYIFGRQLSFLDQAGAHTLDDETIPILSLHPDEMSTEKGKRFAIIFSRFLQATLLTEKGYFYGEGQNPGERMVEEPEWDKRIVGAPGYSQIG